MDGPRVQDVVYEVGVEVRRLAGQAGFLRALLFIVALAGAGLVIVAASLLVRADQTMSVTDLGRSALEGDAGLGLTRAVLVGGSAAVAVLAWAWRRRVRRAAAAMVPFGAIPPARRNPLVRPAALAVAVTGATIATAHLLLAVADSPDVTMLAFGELVVGGLLTIAAAFLVGEAIRWETWRLRVASSLIHDYTGVANPVSELPIVLPRSPNSFAPYAVALLYAVFAGWTTLAVPGGPGACADALTRCDAVVVPLDWSHPDDGRTIAVAYGVLEPAGTPAGTLVIAVGGPGDSGLASARDYAAILDPRLLESHRVVLFDPRGVGASGARDCPQAAAALEIGDGDTRSAELFASRCLEEAGVPIGDAGLYGTAQVVDDLEAIRTALRLDRFALYGVSYGTVVAQAYAERHPDRLTALILDAPVDRSLSSVELWSTAAAAGDVALEAVFDACRTSLDCMAELPDPATTYDAFMERFEFGALNLRITDPVGIPRHATFDRYAFQDVVFSLLYEPYGRMILQRALAAAERRDDATLGAMLVGGGIEDEWTYFADAEFSDFAYYAASCTDYRTSPTDRPKDRPALLAAGEASGVLDLRMGSVYLGQVPCLYWPAQPVDPARPDPLRALPFPTFVLVSTTDPVTPAAYGRAIADSLEDAVLLETIGGAHSTMWRGDGCVDGPVVDFLVDGTRPDRPRIQCVTELAYPYIPLSPSTKQGATALDVMLSLEDELWASASFVYWDGSEELRYGCLHAGSIRARDRGDVVSFEFHDCEQIPDLPVDGSGTYTESSNVLELDVVVEGGELSYRSSPDDARVTGTFNGRTVDERY